MWSRVKSGLRRLVPGLAKADSQADQVKMQGNRTQSLRQDARRLSVIPWLLLAGIALAAIWWLGPLWVVGESRPLVPWHNRLLASLALGVIVSVVWGVRLSRRLQEFRDADEHKELLQHDPVRGDVERQETSLNATLAELTASLGGGRKARYKLPWYLVMGVENAGKTSLINRSGQNFSLTHVLKVSGQGKRNRHGFDWWIGDKAVLIDPDGELLTQKALTGGEPAEPESRLWDHFITWLERERTRRPLDGIVLVLDLANLSHAKVGVRKAYAALMRARMRELMERLSTRLPVYVTFSKMDLLHGFDDFFRHYSRDERRAPLGFTFSAASLDQPERWEEEFATAYDGMLERLNARLPALLAECRDGEERQSVFRFVRQLAGLRDVLLGFLQEALASDRFSTAAMVRGTYFTSVYQQGVPEDPFVDAAARRYGMADSVQSAHRAARSALFFSEELFDKIIYPEAGLAGDNARASRRRHRLHRASVMACLFGGAVLVGGWSHFYQKNALALAAVEEKAHDFTTSRPAELQSGAHTGHVLLDTLDRLRGATLEFGDFRAHMPVIADMGLYQGNRVGREVEGAYLATLEYRFLPALMIDIMDEMNRAQPNSNEKLALLRVLRMLSDASGRQPERVHEVMANRWRQEFPHQGSVQQRLLAHLDYAMAYTDLEGDANAGQPGAITAMTPLRGSIEAAQRELAQIPMAERVYRALAAGSTQRSAASLDLRQGIGPAWSTVFRARNDDPRNVLIPGLATRDGFEHYFLPKLDQATELALIDLWVLGRRENIDFSDADKRHLRDALRELYVSDYSITWREALAQVELVPFQDIDQAVVVMDSLLGASRPLDRLLGEVARNTELYPQLPIDDDTARQALERSLRYQLAGEIDRSFSDLNHLMTAQNDNPADIVEIKRVIADLRDYLRQVQGANDPGRTAFVIARDRLVLGGEDPIGALGRIAKETPAPVDRMLAELADQSWQLLLNDALRHLERQWLDDVVAPYEQRLAGRYPLAPDARRDVALEDFERFFGPKGILISFYQDNLRPFLEGASEQLRDNNGNPLLRDSVLASLERAKRIREAYFDTDGLLDVEFSLEPVNLTPDKRRSVISVDGQLIEYLHGPRSNVPMIWPNSLRHLNESRVTLVPSQINRSPRSLRRQGAWAWFRLLDEADITGASEHELELRFNVDGGTMHYRLHSDRSPNPFTRPLTAGFSLPTALYGQGGVNDADET
ncbi:type VI secretion system protein ImpL [Modicisalibacter ilicicola DSM 19980]|uniref:Type VI secretion system protein ImpL n=1 Tax=Modicisalibacter ilicicola DSM 19980 TaxID=1121942 RepID=A0A1M5B3H4_9GAMM|nr:type VI secretion system membrane subunit TssM [Halomonas ilicicola]SHF37043.1 type VI secretion system protein ImpL [Halomonas ilicicola DSM 19980]